MADSNLWKFLVAHFQRSTYRHLTPFDQPTVGWFILSLRSEDTPIPARHFKIHSNLTYSKQESSRFRTLNAIKIDSNVLKSKFMWEFPF